MATFQPDELLDAALRKLATELGVPADAGRNRAEIEQDIQQHHPHTLLLSSIVHSSPLPNNRARDWANWVAIGLTALTAIFTAYIAYANSDSAKTARDSLKSEIEKTREAREKQNADTEEAKKQLWQLVVLFKIIDEGYITNPMGMTLSDIRSKYQTEAASAPHDLKINDKDELAIRRLLLELLKTHLVYLTTDFRYGVVHATYAQLQDPCKGKIAEEVRSYIVNLLTKESEAGKYNILELSQKAMEAVKGATVVEANCVIVNLVSRKEIIVGPNYKFWSAANAPKKIIEKLKKPVHDD